MYYQQEGTWKRCSHISRERQIFTKEHRAEQNVAIWKKTIKENDKVV